MSEKIVSEDLKKEKYFKYLIKALVFGLVAVLAGVTLLIVEPESGSATAGVLGIVAAISGMLTGLMFALAGISFLGWFFSPRNKAYSASDRAKWLFAYVLLGFFVGGLVGGLVSLSDDGSSYHLIGSISGAVIAALIYLYASSKKADEK